jgi:hypothetical protein
MSKNSQKLNGILGKKAGILARKALRDPKLAKRISNRLLLKIKKDGIKPGLSFSWKVRRGELAKHNKTDRWYARAFSNLTFTGQFLKSFKAKIVEKVNRTGRTKILFTTGPTGDHKPYKKTSEHVNFKEGETISNKQLGEYLIKGGRDYTEITPETKKQITKSLKSAILKEFKLNLNRKY